MGHLQTAGQVPLQSPAAPSPDLPPAPPPSATSDVASKENKGDAGAAPCTPARKRLPLGSPPAEGHRYSFEMGSAVVPASSSEQRADIGLVDNDEYAAYLTDEYGLLDYVTPKVHKVSGVGEAAQGDAEDGDDSMTGFQLTPLPALAGLDVADVEHVESSGLAALGSTSEGESIDDSPSSQAAKRLRLRRGGSVVSSVRDESASFRGGRGGRKYKRRKLT